MRARAETGLRGRGGSRPPLVIVSRARYCGVIFLMHRMRQMKCEPSQVMSPAAGSPVRDACEGLSAPCVSV